MELITAIINKNPQAVENILGPPVRTIIVNPPLTPCREKGCLKAYYLDEEIEVIFIDNTADWITIYNKQNRSLVEFIKYIGLKDFKPVFDFRNTKRYTNVYGLKEINLHPNEQGNIWMVYIKAFTE